MDIKAKLALLKQEEEKIKEKYRKQQEIQENTNENQKISVTQEDKDHPDSLSRLRTRLKNKPPETPGKPASYRFHLSAAPELPRFFRTDSTLGPLFYRETVFSLNHQHGESRIRETLEIPKEILAFLGNTGENRTPDLTKTLFLDTETTGLAGGTGTFAFLIGAGFFRRNTFVVRQYFSPDYQYESAKLQDLNELMKEYPGLVTFNGRSFDMPIIQSRMVLNRLRPAIPDPPHLDLLFPARRLWKRTIGSCRLTSLERAILRFYREDDIPGALIPGIYMQYLEEQDFYPMEKVLEHNLYDIVTMAALLPRMWAHLEMADQGCLESTEHLSLGCVYENRSAPECAVDQYRKALERCKDPAERREILLKLAAVYKGTKRPHEAVELWEELAAGARFDITGHVELAKYYEHRIKDYEKALFYTAEALELVHRKKSAGAWGTFYREQDELLRRQQRLTKKLGKSSG